MNSIVYCTQEFECDVGGDQQRSRGQNLLPESVLEKKSGHVTPHETTTHVWLPGLVCASSEPWLMTRCCVYTFRWAERQKTSVYEWNKNPSREVCGGKKKYFKWLKYESAEMTLLRVKLPFCWRAAVIPGSARRSETFRWISCRRADLWLFSPLI